MRTRHLEWRRRDAAIMVARMLSANPQWIELVGAGLFGLAVLHTFSTRYFGHLAHTQPAHSGLWHLLGEVETVFGFWAFVLLVFMALALGWGAATGYLDERRFVEPMFVFVIMVIAASRPIMQLAGDAVGTAARALPLERGAALLFVSLALVPLLGSLITEPAAMTLAALMLRDTLFSRGASSRLKYAALGVLFVNVSIGGTLTSFAAPPVLMVAAKWGWSTPHILGLIGWKAALAVCLNAALLVALFGRQISRLSAKRSEGSAGRRVPASLVAVNLVILALVVLAHRETEVFMGLFLLFLGLAEAYKRHHDRLLLREGLMVAFFLAGLVVLGGQQRWWLEDVLSSLDGATLFFGAAALTAITDNAALTYLGSLVEGTSEAFRYALVAGAVAGGGLTVIANAPNPAGFAILKDSFHEQSIHPLGLLAAALPPTAIAIACLWGLRGSMAEVFDLAAWGAWFDSLDRGFLFLLILPFVVAAVGLWAERNQRTSE
jgi:hypothetical protein